MTSEINVGSRIRSGGLSLDNKRGVEVIRFANWSWLTLNVTFGNCLWNSSASAGTVGNPDSKTAFSSTGSVPQVGPAAAALAAERTAAALGGAALAARRLPESWSPPTRVTTPFRVMRTPLP